MGTRRATGLVSVNLRFMVTRAHLNPVPIVRFRRQLRPHQVAKVDFHLQKQLIIILTLSGLIMV